MMGSTPFFATPNAFPDWRFENMDERDLLSLHVDDFLAVPWSEFATSATPTLPAAWVARWTDLRDRARASGKTLYLAVSPLGDRITLAPRVDAAGNAVAHWAPVDAKGCYRFATDPGAATYRTAYINYLKYVVQLVQPKYLSPAVEMNIQFNKCAAADKAAYIAWYTQVDQAIRAAFPTLVVFPTMQVEHLYGVADASVAPSGSTSARNSPSALRRKLVWRWVLSVRRSLPEA